MEYEKTMKEKILKAAEYIKEGDPLKDALDDDDIKAVVLIMAELIKTGIVK